MKTIIGLSPKYGDKEILVDDADFEYVSKFKWFLRKVGKTFYAQRNAKVGELRTAIQMHRELLSVPAGLMVDHKNHNTLDNRRENLRICTQFENQHNQQATRGGSSKYKGITWVKKSKKWRTMITTYGYAKHLGLFNNEEEAAMAYDYYANIEQGEYAVLNFPDRIGTYTPPPVKRKLPPELFKGTIHTKVATTPVIPEQPKAATQQSLFL